MTEALSRSIHRAMVGAGFRRDRSQTRTLAFNGSLQTNAMAVPCRVEFGDPYFTKLPLLSAAALTTLVNPPPLAHIEAAGHVCYAQEAEVQLDMYDPESSVGQCLELMRRALDRIIRLDLSDEIEREFPQHWFGLPVYLASQAAHNDKGAFLYAIRRESRTLLILSNNSKELLRFGVRLDELKGIDTRKKPVAILHCDAALTFRSGQQRPINFEDLLGWADALSKNFSQRIIGALACLPKENLNLFIYGPNGTVGCKIDLPIHILNSVQRQKFIRYILTNHASKLKLQNYVGVRCDEDYILGRNLGNKVDLAGKRVAIVGIGTVGGFLSALLAQSGAGHEGGSLLLFDEQELAPANVGRHQLGLRWVGVNKATAIRAHLGQLLPDREVIATEGNVLKYLDDLRDCDLVIDVTGERSISDALNSHFLESRRSGKPTAKLIFGWLVANGVAAQGLIIDGDEGACFRCLRQKDGGPRFQIVKTDHPALITPASCMDGAYFAYGVGAPMMAAGLVLQMTLDLLAERPSPKLRTIRINHEATNQIKDQDPSRLEGCPCCG
jgi:hypothetical protein